MPQAYFVTSSCTMSHQALVYLHNMLQNPLKAISAVSLQDLPALTENMEL